MKGLFAKLLGRYRETDFLFPERLFMRLENHVSQSKMRLLSEEMFCKGYEWCEKRFGR